MRFIVLPAPQGVPLADGWSGHAEFHRSKRLRLRSASAKTSISLAAPGSGFRASMAAAYKSSHEMFAITGNLLIV
jgi:hypothetical protein